MDAEAQKKFAREVCAMNLSRREYVAMKRKYLMSQVNQKRQGIASQTSSDESPPNSGFTT